MNVRRRETDRWAAWHARWLLGWRAVLSAAGTARGEVVVVRDGIPAARVVVAKTASQQVKNAAGTLIQYVFEASGARLELILDDAVPADPAGPLIHVGPNRLPVTQNLLPAGLDDDGWDDCRTSRCSSRGC